MRYGLTIGLFSVMLAAVPASAQTVVYVDMNATGPTHDGTSWCQAYLTLDDALAVAGVDTAIRVADGTYLPSVQSEPGLARTETFQLINEVTLEGGYAGCGADDPDERDVALYETILSGDIGSTGLDTDNSFHVVTGSGTDATAVLDGFTITGGNADRQFLAISGGGMYNFNGSPTLTRCTFSGNSARSGAGMLNYHSSPTLTNCSFSANLAAGEGGGIRNIDSSPTLSNCTFTQNSAQDGCGMHSYRGSPTLTNCIFSRNSAERYGGGMHNSESNPTLVNCTFTDNAATTAGGGIHNRYNSNPTLTNVTFSGNSAFDGGGIYSSRSSPTLTNCTLKENSAVRGGALWNENTSLATLLNCVVWSNTTALGPQIYEELVSTTTVSFSCVEDGWAGVGNIDVDPLLGPDLQLGAGSPCIDAGDNTAVPADMSDLDGDGDVAEPLPLDLGNLPRFFDDPTTVDSGIGIAPIVDMGAYEYAGDCNTNGVEDMADILGGSSTDCNTNSVPDECELGGMADCNGSGISDLCDITSGSSEDCNANVVPDECETGGMSDCNVNGIPDLCDLAAGSSRDCDTNGIPDDCEGYPTGVIYVDDDAVGGLGNGSNWTDAFLELRDALAYVSCADVSEIRVAEGTYEPGLSRTDTFQLINGIALRGGYRGVAGGGDPDDRDVAAFVSVLSGDIGSTGVVSDNSHHVVTGSGTDATAVLDGFTITGGYSRAWGKGAGGGMYNFTGSPTLIDCTFSGNTASANGGGMANYTSSSPTLINCTFRGNVAGYNGGGMLNRDNSSPTLTHCTFVENSTGDKDFSRNGGGMVNWRDSNPTLIDCTFSGNSSSNGGGMYNNDSSPTRTNCTFTENSASKYFGGGMCFKGSRNPTLTNCTFSGNWANRGGGVAARGAINPVLINCTLIGNSADEGGGIYNNSAGSASSTSPTLTNCIVWGNTAATGPQFLDDDPGSVTTASIGPDVVGQI